MLLSLQRTLVLLAVSAFDYLGKHTRVRRVGWTINQPPLTRQV